MRYATWVAVTTVFLALPAAADDWPQWLGPQRDSVWREAGIVDRITDQGLKVRWRAPIAYGYSGPAVAGGNVLVMDYVKSAGDATNNPGGRDMLQGTERVVCLDAATGEVRWQHAYPRAYNLSYPLGPRCTPTIDGPRVYTLGAEGDLFCLSVADGSVVWKKDLCQAYNTTAPIWGFAAHPLVDGELLYCVVGGAGSVAVAFDKRTGREVWRALDCDEPGYCPPTMIQHAGVRQLLIWHPQALNSLEPATGKLLWSVPLKPDYHMSVTAPRKLGDNLFASGIGNVGVLLRLTSDRPGAEVVWRGDVKSSVYCCNSTPFLHDGMIYGNDCRTGELIGARIRDGQRLWQTWQPTSGGERRAGHATAFIVRHEDRYFLFSETGDLILARLTPEGYQEEGRFRVLEPTNEAFGRPVVWSHPAFANRSLYARNDKELVCVDLAAARPAPRAGRSP